MTSEAKPRVPDPERRTRAERRRKDVGPPSGWERRRGVEPRRPEVAELEFSPSQWDALQAEAFPPGAAASVEKR